MIEIPPDAMQKSLVYIIVLMLCKGAEAAVSILHTTCIPHIYLKDLKVTPRYLSGFQVELYETENVLFIATSDELMTPASSASRRLAAVIVTVVMSCISLQTF